MRNKYPLEIIMWHSSTVWPEPYKRHGKFPRDLHNKTPRKNTSPVLLEKKKLTNNKKN